MLFRFLLKVLTLNLIYTKFNYMHLSMKILEIKIFIILILFWFFGFCFFIFYENNKLIKDNNQKENRK